MQEYSVKPSQILGCMLGGTLSYTPSPKQMIFLKCRFIRPYFPAKILKPPFFIQKKKEKGPLVFKTFQLHK